MADEQQQYASMDPADFSVGGGLFDDVDATITGAAFTPNAPEGYTPEGNPLFFVLKLRIDGDDADVEQSYSIGGKSGDNFTIGQDGGVLVPTNGPASKIVSNCKFGIFMGALKSAQFPMSKLGGPGGSITNLVGTRAHFNRIADPERKGLMTGKKEKKYPETTLCVSKVHSLPGAAAAPAKGKAAKSAAVTDGRSAPAANAPKGDTDLTAVAEEMLMTVLMENDGEVQRGKFPMFAVRAIGKHPEKPALSKLIISDEFLSRETSWKYDRSVVPPVLKLAA